LFSSNFKIRIIEGIKNSDLIVHIGISGWSSFHEEDVLYPQQLPPRQELDCYIQHYQTVEVNSTYYRWAPNATFAFLAIAPPPRISDDRKSAPRSLRTPSIFTRRSPIASTSRKVRGDLCSSTSTTTEREMQFGTLQG
jgi:hypothetical protein